MVIHTAWVFKLLLLCVLVTWQIGWKSWYRDDVVLIFYGKLNENCPEGIKNVDINKKIVLYSESVNHVIVFLLLLVD